MNCVGFATVLLLARATAAEPTVTLAIMASFAIVFLRLRPPEKPDDP